MAYIPIVIPYVRSYGSYAKPQGIEVFLIASLIIAVLIPCIYLYLQMMLDGYFERSDKIFLVSPIFIAIIGFLIGVLFHLFT